MSYVRTPPYVFAHMADAVIAQANPVSGTRYAVLRTSNARIISLFAQVTWTVQPDPLEIHMTIDGQTLRWYKGNPVTATGYEPENGAAADPGWMNLNITGYFAYRAFILEGRQIFIEAETTGGTVSLLDCRVKYAKIV